MSLRTLLKLSLTTAIAAVVFVYVSGPGRPGDVAPGDPSLAQRTVRGAFHIHTTRSDGALDKSAVAAAAARAGLRFAVFTDHGTGMRRPDPPEYLDGVLCLDGVEVSTNDGHYIALGMKESPYPLGGDGAAVAEDVARLGGFGIVAHPVSARPELAWTDWSAPLDALEWLNADSEWRDERRLRLARGLLDYFWRPAGALAALLDRPVEALRQWDRLTVARPIVSLAGHDAHGGFGAEDQEQRGRRLHVPSYEAMFRTFSINALLPAALSGEPAADADAVLGALRRGSVFSAVDAIASPASLDFSGSLRGTAVGMGGVLPDATGPAEFAVRAGVPSGGAIVLRRNGVAVAESRAGELSYEASQPGVYRVEISVAGAPGTPPVPWIVSNPIYRPPFAATQTTVQPVLARGYRLADGNWRVEADSGSSGGVTSSGGAVRLDYRLKDGAKTSQFVALVVDLENVPAGARAVVFRGSADRPMRISMQLRFAQDDDRRWAKSAYIDSVGREVEVPLNRLRYTGPRESAVPLPPVTRASSLLFVIDLTNAVPGTGGSFTLRDVAIAD